MATADDRCHLTPRSRDVATTNPDIQAPLLDVPNEATPAAPPRLFYCPEKRFFIHSPAASNVRFRNSVTRAKNNYVRRGEGGMSGSCVTRARRTVNNYTLSATLGCSLSCILYGGLLHAEFPVKMKL